MGNTYNIVDFRNEIGESFYTLEWVVKKLRELVKQIDGV
jgi:hypothetical protein